MKSFLDDPKTIRKYFEQHGQKMVYDKKQVFIRSDDPQPWVYFLNKGIVEATYSFDDGIDRILGYFIPRSIFAQNKLFNQDDRGDLKYTAVEKSEVYRIHRDKFLSRIDIDHEFTKEYLKNTLVFRIFTTDLVIYLGESRLHNRLIRWLLLMAKYYGEPDGRSCRIGIPMTHDVIANFLHVSRESISKVLRQLSRDGLISVDKKIITIHSIEKLRDSLNAT